MKVVFVCQAVDEDDPILAATVSWIEEFSRRVEALSVLTLRLGRHRLPKEVPVWRIGRSWRIATLFQFYRHVLRLLLRRRSSCFFVYHSGPYPILLMPFKLFGKRVFQWVAHSRISPVTRLCARYCDDRVFTCTHHSFHLPLAHRVVLGHGVDLGHFKASKTDQRASLDLVTVARISPIKRIDWMVSAVAECNRRFGVPCRLHIYGPIYDESCKRALTEQIRRLGIGDRVIFKGSLPHEQLPAILPRYKLFLHYCDGALDKAVVEAMACGLPVLSSNACVEEILREKHRGLLIEKSSDAAVQAQRICRILELDEDQARRLSREMRQIVEREHGLGKLVGRMVGEMREVVGVTRSG